MVLPSSFERIILKKIDGKNSHEWFELGAMEKGPEKKVECFRNSVEIKPDFVRGWTALGNAYSGMGEYEKAMECYDKALSICSKFKEARLNRRNLEKKMKEAELKPGT